MSGIMMSHAAIAAQAGASGGGGGPLTYYSQRGYNAAGKYGNMGVGFSNDLPGVWICQRFGWFDPADFTTIIVIANGTSFSMDFAGTTYTGTLSSGFAMPEFDTSGNRYDASVSWVGDAPAVGGFGSPNSVTINGVTYYNRYPIMAPGTFDFTSQSVAVSTIQVKVTGNLDSTNWSTVSEFNSIIALTTGTSISVTYEGNTYIGTLSSGFVDDSYGSYFASITWVSSTGLPEGYEAGVESITI